MIQMGLTYLTSAYGHDLALWSDFWCKFFPCLARILSQTSSWIQVLITFDRYILIAHPSKACHLKNRKLISWVIIVTILLLCLINVLPNLFFYIQTTEIILQPNTNQTHVNLTIVTTISCTSRDYIVLVRDLISVLFRTIVPFVLICYGNFSLIQTFLKSKRKIQQMADTSSISSSLSKLSDIRPRKENNFIYSIIFLDTVFLVTLLPLTITTIMFNIYQYIPSIGSVVTQDACKLAYYMTVFIASLSSVFPFLITYFTNKIFKRECHNFLIELKSKILEKKKMNI